MDAIPKPLFWGYLLLFALLPWSVECSFGTAKLTAPSEPLMVILGVALARVIIQQRQSCWAVLQQNRLLQLTAAWIGWQAVAASFSTMPVVSGKYWLVEAGQWWVFAVGLALWPGLWRSVLPTFMLSLAGVAVYILIQHGWCYHFRQDQALLAPMPFFPDHTAYAAVLAMVLPWAFSGLRSNITINTVSKNSTSENPAQTGRLSAAKRLFIGLTPLFSIALILSFSRAALLSVLVIAAVSVVFFYRKYRPLFALAGFLGLVFLLINPKKLQQQAQDYWAKDVSSKERLNRYACARRMTADRPWTGFGPGTFQFQYLAYQRPEDMTRISVTAPIQERGPDNYGRGGGAHSEYWQAAAETGRPGLALWLTWAVGALWLGMSAFFGAATTVERAFVLTFLLSLLTFFLHGLVNNFLHDGRMAALVWAQVSVLGGLKYWRRD